MIWRGGGVGDYWLHLLFDYIISLVYLHTLPLPLPVDFIVYLSQLMLVAFLLMISPIRGLARLGAVARDATPATNQVTRLSKVGVLVAMAAETPMEPTPMRPNSSPTPHCTQIHKDIFQRICHITFLVRPYRHALVHLSELIARDGAEILIECIFILGMSCQNLISCLPNSLIILPFRVGV